MTSTTTSVPGYQYLTGNWEFSLIPSRGPVPFPTLAGFLDEEAAATSTKNSLVALTQIEQPGSCYTGGNLLPLQGTVDGTAVSLFSFSFDGQYLSLNATKDATASSMTGTYSIGLGCADGYAGTISGVRYAALSGSYSGATTVPAEKLSVTLTQAALGNANGMTNVSGTATFAGISCFSTGTVNGTVLGRLVHLTIATNEAGGSQVSVTGTFDPAASAIQASSLMVTGGSCAGSLGTASLTH